MRKLLLPCVAVLLFSFAALAQNQSPASTTRPAYKAAAGHTGEAYFGYSHFTSGKNGWEGDLGYNLGKNIVALGDLGGYYSHNNDIHSFMFGARVQATPHQRGFTPWGRFLIGGSHVSNLSGASDTAWSWALGGGVDTAVRRRLGLRLSADAFHTHFYNDGDLHLRLGAGLVYRF